jgi:hypothetical protein
VLDGEDGVRHVAVPVRLLVTCIEIDATPEREGGTRDGEGTEMDEFDGGDDGVTRDRADKSAAGSSGGDCTGRKAPGAGDGVRDFPGNGGGGGIAAKLIGPANAVFVQGGEGRVGDGDGPGGKAATKGTGN